jgi:hypothetical protein
MRPEDGDEADRRDDEKEVHGQLLKKLDTNILVCAACSAWTAAKVQSLISVMWVNPFASPRSPLPA